MVTLALVEVATTVREQEVNAKAAHRWSAQGEFPFERGVCHTRRKFQGLLGPRNPFHRATTYRGRNRNCRVVPKGASVVNVIRAKALHIHVIHGQFGRESLGLSHNIVHTGLGETFCKFVRGQGVGFG